MNTFSRHYMIRLKATLTNPFAFCALFLSALAGLMYWPGLMEPTGPDTPLISIGEGVSETVLLLIWIFIWPMVAGNAAGGSAAGGRRAILAAKPQPSLPIGPRTRVLAETLLVLTFVLAVRVPACLLGDHFNWVFYLPGLMNPEEASAACFAKRSLWGALIMFPSIMAWAAPARSSNFYLMARPLTLGALLLVAIKLGFLADPLPCAWTCLVLSAGVLLTVGREPAMLGFQWRPNGSPASRFRPCTDPESQLRRDLWLKPVPWIGSLLALQAGLVVLDRCVVLPDYGYYLLSCIVIGFMFSQVVLRPMGSIMIAAKLRRYSSGSGEFMSAWSTLPVRREAVLRAVYLHGLTLSAFTWMLGAGINMFNTRLERGVWAMMDPDGDSAVKYIVPFAALVPCIAGGLTCAAVGDKVRGFTSLAAGVAVLFGHHIFLVMKLPTQVHTALIISFAIAGGVPQLVHLRKTRASHNNDPMSNKKQAPIER